MSWWPACGPSSTPGAPEVSRTCTCCTHPERAALDAAALGGESGRAIAGRFGVSRAAVQRHRAAHLAPAQAQAAAELYAERVTLARPLAADLADARVGAAEALRRARARPGVEELVRAAVGLNLIAVREARLAQGQPAPAGPPLSAAERAQLDAIRADPERLRAAHEQVAREVGYAPPPPQPPATSNGHHRELWPPATLFT